MKGGARKGAGRPPVSVEERKVSPPFKLHPRTVQAVKDRAAAEGTTPDAVIAALLAR